MKLILSGIPKKLNKAYLKQDLSREKIEVFKSNLEILFAKAETAETKKEHEEHFKNIVSDFLKDTWYKNNFEININKRKDLAIHNGKSSSDAIAVIIEAKKPSNETEMVSDKAPNAKALHELVHYYLHERIINNNKEIKHLVATNSYDWYIFDASDFEKHFFENKAIRKNYEDWHSGSLPGTTTDWFYNQVAKPYIDKDLSELEAVHFNLLDYKAVVENQNPADDDKLINLYKILSPEHLLKKPFANDSNSLNKEFYNELLHIIGLEERPDGGKKLIDRKSPEKRDEGSLLENTMNIVKTRKRINNIQNPEQFGQNDEEQLFSISLELCIMWLNRVLFLKLLEGQLLKYHNGNPDYAFINSIKIKDYDELDELFFEVLALDIKERLPSVNEKYGHIPYLNSSLFEISKLESETIQISDLKDRLELPIYAHSVLKNKEGNKGLQKKLTLHYLFEFLEAYNFSSDSSARIQENNKTIINASVLGLIFEKINGYKDGSFFTPGFITMYMCRETIRRAVAQKFNELENKEIETFGDVKNYCARFFKKEDIARFNKHINSLKICDPAVGSGHFLVSALNELIAIKSELNILTDIEGTPLEYEITVDNDELTILNKRTNKPFEYILGADNKPPKALQQVQVCLFQEKQRLIENCLFGVDINPKSVLICRLRLWIELLKNAYYKFPSFGGVSAGQGGQFPSVGGVSVGRGGLELETLPNIDINIKCGNSLISRYPLDTNIKQLLRSSKWTIETYRLAISSYRNAKNKDEKYAFEELILKIKQEFSHEIRSNDPLKTRLDKLSHELYNRFTGNFLFEPQMSYGKKEAELEKKKKAEQKKLENEINAITQKINDIKDSVIYKNAFEWRFEFPEVMDDDGNFLGFDVVIGNPPYGVNFLDKEINYYRNSFDTIIGHAEIYYLFIELAITRLLNKKCILSFIIPNAWMSNKYAKEIRKILINNNILEIINFNQQTIFEDAQVETSIIIANKEKSGEIVLVGQSLDHKYDFNSKDWKSHENLIINFSENSLLQSILNKINNSEYRLSDFLDISNGCKPYQVGYGKNLNNEPFNIDDVERRIYHSNTKETIEYFKELKGRHVHSYFIQDSEEYIKWGNWLMSPKEKKYHFQPKLLIRQIIGKRFIASIDYRNNIADQTLYICIPFVENSKISLEFALGVLNSEMYGFFFRKFYSEEDDLFPKIKVNELKQLPFILPTLEMNESIRTLVLEILDCNKINKTDTTHLEKEIDQLVYQLYGLTEEEIKIVEGN